MKLLYESCRTYEYEQVANEEEQEDSREEMSPNVDTLIMHSEHSLEYFLRSVKIDAIAMSNILVIFHIARGLLVMPNVLFLR